MITVISWQNVDLRKNKLCCSNADVKEKMEGNHSKLRASAEMAGRKERRRGRRRRRILSNHCAVVCNSTELCISSGRALVAGKMASSESTGIVKRSSTGQEHALVERESCH